MECCTTWFILSLKCKNEVEIWSDSLTGNLLEEKDSAAVWTVPSADRMLPQEESNVKRLVLSGGFKERMFSKSDLFEPFSFTLLDGILFSFADGQVVVSISVRWDKGYDEQEILQLLRDLLSSISLSHPETFCSLRKDDSLVEKRLSLAFLWKHLLKGIDCAFESTSIQHVTFQREVKIPDHDDCGLSVRKLCCGLLVSWSSVSEELIVFFIASAIAHSNFLHRTSRNLKAIVQSDGPTKDVVCKLKSISKDILDRSLDRCSYNCCFNGLFTSLKDLLGLDALRNQVLKDAKYALSLFQRDFDEERIEEQQKDAFRKLQEADLRKEVIKIRVRRKHCFDILNGGTAATFVSFTVITGIFGMNNVDIPTSIPYGWMLGVAGFVSALMIIFFVLLYVLMGRKANELELQGDAYHKHRLERAAKGRSKFRLRKSNDYDSRNIRTDEFDGFSEFLGPTPLNDVDQPFERTSFSIDLPRRTK